MCVAHAQGFDGKHVQINIRCLALVTKTWVYRAAILTLLPTCPLHMETVGLCHRESIREKVVLDGGVSLNNVPPLSPHVQVEYLAAAGLAARQEGARSEFKDVAAVLEGSAELGGVDGKTERLVGGGANVDVGVLRDGGADT